MVTSAHNFEQASMEPVVRTITREVLNLRNPAVAEEYKRQRGIIASAAAQQKEETIFWESVQSHEGWD